MNGMRKIKHQNTMSRKTFRLEEVAFSHQNQQDDQPAKAKTKKSFSILFQRFFIEYLENKLRSQATSISHLIICSCCYIYEGSLGPEKENLKILNIQKEKQSTCFSTNKQISHQVPRNQVGFAVFKAIGVSHQTEIVLILNII